MTETGLELDVTVTDVPDIAAERGDRLIAQREGRTLSEATLVARAQDGDASAFEQLVRSYQAELVRLGYRMLSDHGEAQDAVQDTFLLAWRNLPRLSDPQTFHAWIYQIMSRRCLNVSRARTRRRTELLSRAPDDSASDLDRPGTDGPDRDRVDRQGDPASVVQARAVRTGLNAVLDTLPGDLRACWVLKEMHDLTYPEIAYATGVPSSTVRGRIARARRLLMKGMIEWQTSPDPRSAIEPPSTGPDRPALPVRS